MKIRCPPCSHVPGSSIGDYVAIHVDPPPRTKTSHRSAPTSQSNPITFRTLTFVIPRESSFLIFIVNSSEGNEQAFVSTSRNHLHLPSNYRDYVFALRNFKGDVYSTKLLASPDELWHPSETRISEFIYLCWRNDSKLMIFLTAARVTFLWRALTPMLFYRGG